MTKKLLYISLIVCLVLTMNGVAYAVEKIETKPSSCVVVLSEKDIIDELQEKSDKQLEKYGYTKDDIEKIRSFSEEEMLAELAKLPDDELEKRGYSAKEIHDLKVNGRALNNPYVYYGEVRYSIECTSLKYNTSTKRTVLKMKARWQWSKKPLVQTSDVIAMTTEDSAFTINNGSAFGRAVYSESLGGQEEVSAITAKTSGSATGTYMMIPLTKGRANREFAFSGDLTATYEAAGKIKQVVGVCKYAHKEIGLDTSMSVDFNGVEISITPKLVWKSNGEAVDTYKLT